MNDLFESINNVDEEKKKKKTMYCSCLDIKV